MFWGVFMKISVLDKDTVTIGDIDFSVFDSLGEVSFYNASDERKTENKIGNSEAVFLNKTKITKEIVDACPNLKYIGLFATGFNNIDLEYTAKRGITVCNAPDYSTNSVVQHIFALLLEIATSCSEYNRSVKNGDWIKSVKFSYFPYPITELWGKTMGIIGFGSIGKSTANVARALGMNVLINTRTVPQDSEFEFVKKEEIFKKSDVLVLCCPLNKSTELLINEKTLRMMKKTAILINTSRGGVVDEKALCNALNEGIIYKAGLDVLTDEPMNKDCPLINCKNVIITPHTAWASKEARTRLVRIVIENYKSYCNGKPINKVN